MVRKSKKSMKRKRKPMKDIDGQMFVVVVMGIRISLGSKKDRTI